MFTPIKNADIYAHERFGICSILLCGDKIAWVGTNFSAENTLHGLTVIDADDVTRSMGTLIAKANALIQEGVSAWVMTGSYHLPLSLLCGGIREDITLIDRVIGVGEIAVSAHRNHLLKNLCR